MSGVAINLHPQVSGGHLREPLRLGCVDKVNGRLYFKVCKSDHVIARLLLGKSFERERVLARTDVVEQLQALRNAHVESLINPPASDSLGLDDDEDPKPARKGAHRLPSDLPSVVMIEAPAIAGVASVKMRTLTRKSHEALWLELSESTIDYLAAAVAAQIRSGCIDNSKQRCVPNDGVYFDKTRRQWRARRRGGKSKYFSSKHHTDPYAAALAWARGDQQEPIGDDASSFQPIGDEDDNPIGASPLFGDDETVDETT